MSDFSDFETEATYDVFISYSSKNKHIADALCHYLEEYKIRCWIAPRDIIAGQEYAASIANAMKRVKIFLLVCSKEALQSQWVRKETNLAVSEGKIILPFKIDDCSFDDKSSMKFYLNDCHWIDAVPKPQEKFSQVVKNINALIHPKTNYSAYSAPKLEPLPSSSPNVPIENDKKNPEGNTPQTEKRKWTFAYICKCFVKNFFKKYFQFKGRTCRHEFCFFLLVWFVIYFCLSFFCENDDKVFYFSLVALIPTLAITVRRLHDADKSGWWILMAIILWWISMYGGLWRMLLGRFWCGFALGGPWWNILMMFSLCFKGTEGPNRFGEKPNEIS